MSRRLSPFITVLAFAFALVVIWFVGRTYLNRRAHGHISVQTIEDRLDVVSEETAADGKSVSFTDRGKLVDSYLCQPTDAEIMWVRGHFWDPDNLPTSYGQISDGKYQGSIYISTAKTYPFTAKIVGEFTRFNLLRGFDKPPANLIYQPLGYKDEPSRTYQFVPHKLAAPIVFLKPPTEEEAVAAEKIVTATSSALPVASPELVKKAAEQHETIDPLVVGYTYYPASFGTSRSPGSVIYETAKAIKVRVRTYKEVVSETSIAYRDAETNASRDRLA